MARGRDEFGDDLVTQGSTLVPTTRASWTAGGGIETKVSRNWSAKTEYLFIDGGDSVNFIANPKGATGVPAAVDQNFHVIKTGLNYRFGGPNDEGFFAFITAPPLPSDHNWNGFYVGERGWAFSSATSFRPAPSRVCSTSTAPESRAAARSATTTSSCANGSRVSKPISAPCASTP